MRRAKKIGATVASLTVVGLAIAPYAPTHKHITKPVVKKITIEELKKYAQNAYSGDDIKFECLDLLWTMESHWNYKAIGDRTAQGYALGIAQALPASKMASIGKDYRTDPYTQIKWGLRYIQLRYDNNACWALKHEFNKGWY